jgi:polysaccharide pyruvyl transferase WcaK-like protein
MVLGRARAVVARDPASFEAIGHLSRSARAVLAIDVAFALPFEDQSARRGGERLRLGVNVSGLLFNEATSGRNRFGLQADYSELMRRFIASRAKRPDVEVHLLAHVTGAAGSWDDDSAVADALAEEFPAAIRAPRFAGPSEAKSYISGLDFLVAGRMHACIAAFSSSVPVVPVAYSRKFSGLFGMLDYPWMVPVRGADTDQALAYLEDCVERRSELAADVRRGMERVDAYLDAYRAELRTFLGSVAASVAAAS